jgi:hypothetical protein
MENKKANVCPIKLTPMAEWIKTPSVNGNCKPCFLGPVSQWYVTELEERGLSDLAKDLTNFIETHDFEDGVEEICKQFDKIKEVAEDSLRERLLDFDCEVQVDEGLVHVDKETN